MGTGKRDVNSYAHPHKTTMPFGLTKIFPVLRSFVHISTDAEVVDARLAACFKQTGAYFRFNPPGLEHVVLDDWMAVNVINESIQDVPKSSGYSVTNRRGSK